jgi:hypothetical protein
MFNENNCLENLKHIVSEYADDENIKNLSLDELRSSYTKIADNIYPISVSNRLKYKNMLWNIDNLKPEIRSRFQAQLFNTWHSVYRKSIINDPTENRPEIKKQESTIVVEGEKSSKINAKQHASVITEQHPIENEKEKSMSSSKDVHLFREMKPVEKQTSITVPKVSANKYENDWFDKLLDFFAAIVGSVAGVAGY